MTGTMLARECYGGTVLELHPGLIVEWLGPLPGWSAPAGQLRPRLKVLAAPAESGYTAGDKITRTIRGTARLKLADRPR